MQGVVGKARVSLKSIDAGRAALPLFLPIVLSLYPPTHYQRHHSRAANGLHSVSTGFKITGFQIPSSMTCCAPVIRTRLYASSIQCDTNSPEMKSEIGITLHFARCVSSDIHSREDSAWQAILGFPTQQPCCWFPV
jgi:hypothetical protein